RDMSPPKCPFDGTTLSDQFGHLVTTNTPANGGLTNGNVWLAGAGFDLLVKPATGDFLGTTVSSLAQPFANVINLWAGVDRGRSPNGYANNGAIGRLVLDGGTNSLFTYMGTGSGNALYVDHLDVNKDRKSV